MVRSQRKVPVIVCYMNYYDDGNSKYLPTYYSISYRIVHVIGTDRLCLDLGYNNNFPRSHRSGAQLSAKL